MSCNCYIPAGMTRRHFMRHLAGASALALPAFAAEPTDAEILNNYANIALAGYEDALTTAKALDVAVEALIANPTDDR